MLDELWACILARVWPLALQQAKPTPSASGRSSGALRVSERLDGGGRGSRQQQPERGQHGHHGLEEAAHDPALSLAVTLAALDLPNSEDRPLIAPGPVEAANGPSLDDLLSSATGA